MMRIVLRSRNRGLGGVVMGQPIIEMPKEGRPVESPLEGEIQKATEQSETFGTEVFVRITGWLVAAGVAGALLCLNAVLDRKICDWSNVRSIAMVFLFCSFMAVMAQIFSAVGRSGYAIGLRLSRLHHAAFLRQSNLLTSHGRLPTDQEWAILRGHIHDGINAVGSARRNSVVGLVGAAACSVVAIVVLACAVWFALSFNVPAIMCPSK